ncbi:MAG: hypothetical protein JWM36_3062 [Hyphomicrobiales bacterium]|nr:hypothetical protein [Hyphomicrobiales bacterium]
MRREPPRRPSRIVSSAPNTGSARGSPRSWSAAARRSSMSRLIFEGRNSSQRTGSRSTCESCAFGARSRAFSPARERKMAPLSGDWEKAGAGGGNRTRIYSLGSCRSTTELRPRAANRFVLHSRFGHPGSRALEPTEAICGELRHPAASPDPGTRRPKWSFVSASGRACPVRHARRSSGGRSCEHIF